MPYPDIDQLLRDERFDELARLSAKLASATAKDAYQGVRALLRRARGDHHTI